MSSQIYCGIGTCPKGKRYGTMVDCAQKKQIRRFGAYKIDTRIIQTNTGESNNEAKRKKVIMKMTKLRGKITRLTKDIAFENDEIKKRSMRKDLIEMKKELSNASKEFEKLNAKRNL